jgi:hypothetical protein
MARFKVQDLRTIEKTPTSPATLRNKLGQLLISSINCTATVEGLNVETGEYRIVLHGSLDKEDSKFDDA